MKPVSSGYADVNGIKLYHDIYGEGEPLVLIHAGASCVRGQRLCLAEAHREFFALLGGGVKEPGWLNTQLSKSRLPVVPGYRHYNFITSPEVPQSIGKFLADPLTNAPAGAAAVSQAAPPPEKRQ